VSRNLELLEARKQALVTRAALQRLQFSHEVEMLRERTRLTRSIAGLVLVLFRWYRRSRPKPVTPAKAGAQPEAGA
jgi:hypothetical protein